MWESCYSTVHELQAHLVKGYLEQFGVPCLVRGARLAAVAPVQVLVRAEFADVARGLIRGRETAVPVARRRATRWSDA